MNRLSQWFRQACTVEPLTVDVWYFDALGCRIDAGTITVPTDGFAEQRIRAKIALRFDGKGSSRNIYFRIKE